MEIKELGHFVLYVRDVDRSAAFYRDVLGWRQILPDPTAPAPASSRIPATAFSAGRTHHELLLIEVGEDAEPIPCIGSSGRVERVLLLAEPPHLDAGEITDKGCINQREVMERRAAFINRRYADGPEDVVIVAGSYDKPAVTQCVRRLPRRSSRPARVSRLQPPMSSDRAGRRTPRSARSPNGHARPPTRQARQPHPRIRPGRMS